MCWLHFYCFQISTFHTMVLQIDEHPLNINGYIVKECFTQIPHLILQTHRGRPPPDQVWVFGMCDTSQCWHVRPGTVIHSDEWAAYRRVQQINSVAQHSIINHSLHFVDTASNTHTQDIGSYWNQVKRKFKRMKGVHSTMLESYLDEFMWREGHGRSASTALCQDINMCYPL